MVGPLWLGSLGNGYTFPAGIHGFTMFTDLKTILIFFYIRKII